MTERLYYNDSYGREFAARVVERSADGRTVYLDRTLFYPASGGQPFDVGSIAGVAVIEVVDEEERIAHRLAAPLDAEGEVAGEIDWARRFDHMQQHTGQHLLTAVAQERFGWTTTAFHLGDEVSDIELDTPGGLLDSTKEIIQGFLRSPVPTVVYVSPPGAWAGSAGCFITVAADVAAMAPTTSIGAAHPVGIGSGSEKQDDTMKQKLENFSSSYIEAVVLATKLGRTIMPVIENFSELELLLLLFEELPQAESATTHATTSRRHPAA